MRLHGTFNGANSSTLISCDDNDIKVTIERLIPDAVSFAGNDIDSKSIIIQEQEILTGDREDRSRGRKLSQLNDDKLAYFWRKDKENICFLVAESREQNGWCNKTRGKKRKRVQIFVVQFERSHSPLQFSRKHNLNKLVELPRQCQSTYSLSLSFFTADHNPA